MGISRFFDPTLVEGGTIISDLEAQSAPRLEPAPTHS